MKIVEEKKSFGPRELPPAETQCARLVHIIDLGTQETKFNNETKHKRQVRLTWELVDSKMQNGDNKGKPFLVGKTYSASLYKSGLLNVIESMTGKAIEFEADGSFDMARLMDYPCMVTVSHDFKGDKVWANVESVSPLPTIKGKKVDCEPSTNHIINFGLDCFDQDTYDMIPTWLKNIIMKSPEYTEIKGNSDLPF